MAKDKEILHNDNNLLSNETKEVKNRFYIKNRKILETSKINMNNIGNSKIDANSFVFKSLISWKVLLYTDRFWNIEFYLDEIKWRYNVNIPLEMYSLWVVKVWNEYKIYNTTNLKRISKKWEIPKYSVLPWRNSVDETNRNIYEALAESMLMLDRDLVDFLKENISNGKKRKLSDKVLNNFLSKKVLTIDDIEDFYKSEQIDKNQKEKYIRIMTTENVEYKMSPLELQILDYRSVRIWYAITDKNIDEYLKKWYISKQLADICKALIIRRTHVLSDMENIKGSTKKAAWILHDITKKK